MATQREKVVFGLWSDITSGQLNRILKPHGVRLVMKTSKEWGAQVHVTAQALVPVVPAAPASPTDGQS